MRRDSRSLPRLPLLRLIVGLLFLFVQGGLGLAHAASAIEQWRSEVARVRLLAQNDVPRAYVEAQRLRDTLPAGALPTDRLKALNLLARIETYLTLTDAAAASAEQALELAQRLGDRIGQAEANLSIAINAVNQGRLDAVNKASIQAMTLLDGANRPELLAEAMLRTAMMYRRSGQFDESVTLSMQTLDIARRSGNALALTYGHQGLAISYDQSDRPDEARQHYALMRDQARAAGSKMLEGSALLGLGGGYSALGDARQAEPMLRESIAIQRTVGAPTWLTSSLYALAEHWRREKRYTEALKLFDEIVAIHEHKRNRLGLWWGLTGRGANHESLGHLAAAHADVERSYALAKEIGQPFYLNESAKRLAILVAADGDYRNAYRYAREAVDITTRDAREKAASRMLELAQRYQSESRQRQIDELNRVNERQAANQRWLWTIFAATLALLTLTACFLLRQRRSNRQLERLNQQLQQSGNKLQATLDAIPDLLFELGLDGRYHDCHSPHSELLAAPVVDLLGRTVAETLPPEAAETCMAALAEAHETGISTGRQMVLELATGPHWFELSVARKTTVADREPRFIVLSRDITERQRTEAALAASEREFRSLAENTPDNICRYDLQGRISYVNPRKEAMAGMEAGQLLGKTVPEAFPDGEKTDYYQQRLQSVIATGEEDEIELELPDRARGIRHHYIRFVAERGAQGEIVGVLAIGRDITERKKAEFKLHASEQMFRAIVENTPDIIVRLDRECRRIYINPAMHRLRNIDLSALLGKTPVETAFADTPEAHASAARAQEAVLQVFRTGQLAETELSWTGPDGKRFHFATHYAPEFDTAGHVTSVVSIGRDITELKESERRFRSLAENMPDNICRHDPQGRMSYLNSRLEATLGIEAGQLLGKTVLEAFPDGRFADYEQRLQAVIATGEENEIELELPVHGHGIRHHYIRFVAERDAEGHFVGVLAIGRDITDLREKERQIEESRDLLRELAEYRDSAREEERKRIAREIHDELGQMLTAQRLDIATLKFQFGMDHPVLGERCQRLLEITDQTIRSVRTIASALRPAALNMGIASALEWLIDEFSQRTGVDCRLHLGQSGLALDENQSIAVFRIVQESLTNVARYAEARQVEIVLKNTGDDYHLSIRDDGKGYDPQGIRPRSFGLLGIRERALMLGGEAHFISAPEQGTTVDIRLPANRKIKAAS